MTNAQRMVSRLLAALGLATAAVIARASVPPDPSKDAVRFAKVGSEKVSCSATSKVLVHFTVRSPMHVQANPASLPLLIATEVKIPALKGLTFGAPQYPPGVPYQQRGLGQSIATYSDSFAVEFPLVCAAGASKAKQKVNGTIRYQPCDDTTCFAPRTEPFTFQLQAVR